MDNKKIYELLELAKTKEYSVCIWGAGYIGKGIGLRILKNFQIKVDYYCDNNEDLWNKEITDGIVCRSINKLIAEKEKTICFLIMRSDYIGEVYEQIKKYGIKFIVTYQDLLEVDGVIQQYYPFMQRNKIAIYTCIVGNYDEIQEPHYISEKCDYFIVSDRTPEKETVFQYLDIAEYLPEELRNVDNTRKNRYIKMHPHKVLPQYRYSIYIDGNLRLKAEMSNCIDNLPRTKIAVAGESYWDSVYVEGIRCIESNRDYKELIMKQMEKYWLEGMPEHFGSFLCNVLVREHNHPICVKIMEDWWKQLAQYSKRDQISFPYVLWTNGYTREDVKTLAPKPGFISDYWIFEHEHRKHRIG